MHYQRIIKVWKENETGGSPRSEDLNSDDEELLINREEVEKGCWHRYGFPISMLVNFVLGAQFDSRKIH